VEEAKLRIKEELEKARKRLEAAELLFEKGMLEDAINRIYYAIFYAARAILNVLGFDAKTHSGVISEFGLRVIKPKKLDRKYGQILRKAFEMRESGDYELGIIFEEEEVKKLLKEAKDFLQAANKFVKEKMD